MSDARSAGCLSADALDRPFSGGQHAVNVQECDLRCCPAEAEFLPGRADLVSPFLGLLTGLPDLDDADGSVVGFRGDVDQAAWGGLSSTPSLERTWSYC